MGKEVFWDLDFTILLGQFYRRLTTFRRSGATKLPVEDAIQGPGNEVGYT